MTQTATPPTSMALASALISSTTVCDENMRFRPANRLSLEKFACRGLPEMMIPPSSTLDSTATTASNPKIGRITSSACPKPLTACSTITPGSVAMRGSNAIPLRSTPLRPR
ncbi:hypothetical protein D3C86_1708440 [compost metagenome]